ncbi:MAG: hypothetical protein R3F07_14765 [Opitutaceae bacterium]
MSKSASLLALYFACVAAHATTVFGVAPDPRDDVPTTQDRPFATFTLAKSALREHARQGLKDDVVVWLRGGHRLSETLELTPRDLRDGRYMLTVSVSMGASAIIGFSHGVYPDEWCDNSEFASN